MASTCTHLSVNIVNNEINGDIIWFEKLHNKTYYDSIFFLDIRVRNWLKEIFLQQRKRFRKTSTSTNWQFFYYESYIGLVVKWKVHNGITKCIKSYKV